MSRENTIIKQKTSAGSSSSKKVQSKMNATLGPSVQTPQVNKQMRRRLNNLDVTISKPATSSNTPDRKFQLNLMYGQYLQALLKQQIIAKRLRSYESSQVGQISHQYQSVYDMLDKYNHMSAEVERASRIKTFKELKQLAQSKCEDVMKLQEDNKLKEVMDELTVILRKHCVQTIFKYCKAIDGEEWEQVLKLLHFYRKYVETILSDGQCVQVNTLAESIRTFSALEDSVSTLCTSLSNLSEGFSYHLLEIFSSHFVREKYE